MEEPAHSSPCTGHRLYTGSFVPDLEAALAQEIASFKREQGPLAPLPILVPTRLLTIYLPRRLAEEFGGHANLRFRTLADLVRSLVPADARPLPPFADELILRGLIEQQIRPESYFGPVREAAGFRSAILSAIRDLKQADISPQELRAAAGSLNRKKFQAFAALYEGYQEALRAKQFADEDDLLKRAIESVNAGFRAGRLFIYGFYDFNHLQRRLVEALASEISITVFMPYHASEAFRYAEPTLRWFEQILGVEAEAFAEGKEHALPPTLENLRSRLFIGRELETREEPDPASLTILSAPGEDREAREILREALHFSETRGCALFHSAVLTRTGDDYAEPLRDSVRSRGFLLHRQGGESSLRSPAAQSVVLLARIVEEGFARKTVLAFLSVAPIDVARVLPESLRPGYQPSLWGQISAEAGIVRGPTMWEDRLGRWIRSRLRRREQIESSGLPATAEFDQRLLAARSLESFIQKLLGALGGAPESAKWSDLVAVVQRAARLFLAASEELEAALGCLRGLSALEPFRETVGWSEFVKCVQEALEAKRESDSRFEEGGLFVGGLESCRGVSWPMVIVPGLVESSFPRVVREDPVLLDEERKVINAVVAGQGSGHASRPTGMATPIAPPGRLALKLAGHDEERLLFQLAVESARERLVLTYPRLDPFSGSARVPSIFLLHILAAVRGGTATFATLANDPLHRFVPLQEVGAGGHQALRLDAREQDLRTLQEALDRGVTALGPYLDAVSPWIGRGLHAERRRWGTSGFTEFDGVFQSDEATRALARSLEGRVWAVTALERYARSPFEFYLTELLGVEELDDPEEAQAISEKDLGSLWHDILRRVTVRFQEERLWPLAESDRQRQRALLHEVAMERFDQFGKGGVTGHPILWEVCREKVLAGLEGWLAWEAEEREFVPEQVEFALPPVEVLGVRIKGRVDRVDRGAGGLRWRIFDYKTGKARFKAESFNQGLALQIPVYLLALESMQKGEASGGYYFYLTQRGGRRCVGWSRPRLREREGELQALLREVVGSIRAGRFFLTDRVRDVVGVTMPQAALEKLMETKQADPRWRNLARVLEEAEEEE